MISFESLYAASQVKSWGLLASDSLNTQGQARGLVLRWSKLEADLRKLGLDPGIKIWSVVCDVLILDESPIVEDTLWIFARRIELEGNRTLTIDGASATATVVAQEIDAPAGATSLPVMFITGSGDPTFKSLTPLADSPATLFSIAAPAHVTTEAWSPQSLIASKLADNLNDGEPLRLGVVTIFQVATLLGASQPTLAMSQLRWLAALADVNPATHVLAGQARTELGWLVKQAQGLVTVPPLDFTVYSTAVNGRVKVLTARSEAYKEWINLERGNADWLRKATLTVSLQENEAQLTTMLQQNAQIALDQAKGAESGATIQLNALRAALTGAKDDFDAGVKKWESDETLQAVLNLLKSIVTLGIEVGKMAAMVAVPGAGVAEAGAEAAVAASGQLDKVKELAQQVTDVGGKVFPVLAAGGPLVESVQRLVEIGKTAERMHKMAADTLKTVDAGLGATFTVNALSGLDTVTGGRQVWQSLQTTMDDVFDIEKELLNKIDGGPKFRVAFRQLVIGAEAYCSARLAVAAATNSLADAKLRSKAAGQAVALTQKYAGQLATSEALYQQLQQEAFGRLLDAKRAVYLELEKYQRAIRYFTLTDPPALPNITASVDRFIETSAEISGYELALDGLRPKPQPMKNVKVNFTITNQQRTDDGDIVVQIDLSDSELKGLARVRIDKMEVSLEGDDGQKILVKGLHLGSSGTYWDRTPAGVGKMFSGDPWHKLIRYDAAGTETVEGSTYTRYGQLIFKPTPFTTWTIRLVDPSVAPRVKTVTLTLVGEVSDQDG